MTTELPLHRLLSEATWLRALARSLLRDGPNADDATQDVWVAALRSPPDESRPPRPWLAQVLRNVVRSGARRARAERCREQEEAALRELHAPPAEGVLERMEMHRMVAEQVMALAEPYRSTLLLRFYEGRPPSEIARAQGLPAGTVRWRINEGLRRLREHLDQLSGGKRERWTRALAPLGSLPGPRPGMAVAPLLPSGFVLKIAGVGAMAVAMALGVAWRAGHTSRVFGHGALGSQSASVQGLGNETGDTRGRREKLKQAAALFGVVVPALTSAASEAALEEAIITTCLEEEAKSFECKEAIVDAILDLQLEKTGGSLTPAERAHVREVRLQVAEKNMAVPLEQRREGCRSFIDGLDPWAKNIFYLKGLRMKACSAEQDCSVRARCVAAVLKQVGVELDAISGGR